MLLRFISIFCIAIVFWLALSAFWQWLKWVF